MKKSNKQKKLPRFKDGNPWAFATDPKKGMTMGQAQGIGNIAAGIGGFATSVGARDEEVNGADYAGGILSNAGSLAASGAALGPWGAVGGAVLGAGIGIYQTIEQDKARDRELQQNSINRGLYETSFASDSKRTTDNIRNNYNYRVPGFKNGTPSAFAPNAMIANEEGIKDPITGQLSVVPGTYDPSNPDKVMANLAPGTSVYSNNKPVPGGKSTPAKLISRMKTVQNMADKVLSGKHPSSRIDKATAELNKKNIDIQTELLNMNTVIQNLHTAQKHGKLPKYSLGTPGAWNLNDGDLDENKFMIGDGRSFTYDIDSSFDENTLKSVHSNDVLTKAYESYKSMGGKESYSLFRTKLSQTPGKLHYLGEYKTGNPPETVLRGGRNGGTSTSTSTGNSVEATATAKPNNDKSSKQNIFRGRINVKQGQTAASKMIESLSGAGYNVSVLPKDIADGALLSAGNNLSRNRNGYLNYAPGEYDFEIDLNSLGINNANGPIEHPRSSVERLSFRNNTDVPQLNQDALNRLKTPLSINPEEDYLNNDKLFTGKNSQQNPTELPEFTITAPSVDTNDDNGNGDDDAGLKSDLFKSTIGDKLSNIGTDLMSLAPVAYNMFNSNPEVFQPRMDRYTNPNLRANISKNIEDARRQRQIARYNQRNISSGSGMGSMFGSSIYSGGIEALNNIMSSADNQNNQYRAASADISNKVHSANANEMRRIDDLNARNRAAARNMKSTALSQLSQYGQNKQLMKNMQKSDILNSKIWEAYSAGVISPEVMERITGMPASKSKKSSVNDQSATSTQENKQQRSSAEGSGEKTVKSRRGNLNYSASGIKNKSLDPNTYINIDEWAKKFKK